MKKLLFIITSLKSGGAEKNFSELVTTNSGRNKVSVLVFEPVSSNLVKKILNNNIKIYEFDKKKHSPIMIILLVVKHMVKHKPDLIISFLFYSNLICSLPAFLTCTPHIVCERNNIFIQFNAGIKHKILLYFYSLSCYLSSGISTVSDSLKNIIINKLNIKRTRISTIYNYVSKVSNKIRYDETFVDDAKIYFIGRFEPQKNIPLLINAFNRLQDSYGYQSLHLIGDGSLSKLIQSNVKNYKFHKKIYFHGYSKDPFKLVSNNSILVLPSLYEGFPNVILEAMSVGMVVVSSDCETGPSEIISNKDNGFLFKNNDLDDLIYLLKSIIDGSYDLNAVSKKAIAKANQFSSYRMMSSYDNLINGCIDQKFKV